MWNLSAFGGELVGGSCLDMGRAKGWGMVMGNADGTWILDWVDGEGLFSAEEGSSPFREGGRRGNLQGVLMGGRGWDGSLLFMGRLV